jgi:hypothetical protein
MVKNFLRNLEKRSWNVVANPINPQQQGVSAPTQPSAPPQGGFRPVNPSAPTHPQVSTPDQEVDRNEVIRQQLKQQQDQLSGTSTGQNMDLRLRMTQWLRANAGTQMAPRPEWIQDEQSREVFTQVMDQLKGDKVNFTNPILLKVHAWVEQQRAAKKAQEPAEAQPQAPQKFDEKDEYLINTFSQNHEMFVNSVQRSLWGEYKDTELVGEAMSRLATEYLGPPRAAHLQDNRLALLTRPETLGMLKQVPGFGDRINRDGIDQKVAEISALPVGSRQRTEAINSLSPYLKESAPGMEDSLVDALTSLVSEPDLPLPLKKFLRGAAGNLAKQIRDQKMKQDQKGGKAILDNKVGDENSPSRGDMMGAGDALKVSDMEIGEGEKDLMFERLRQIVGGKIQPVKELSSAIMDDFYKHYNTKGELPSVKVGDIDLSVPDIFQAIASAGAENVNRLIQPGNQKLKQQAFKQIEKNQQEDTSGDTEEPVGEDGLEGYQEVTKKKPTGDETSFSSRGGSIKLNMGGKNLGDMGVSLRGLVQAPSLKPYFYQLGLIKEAIFNTAKANKDPNFISQQVERMLPQIEQQQRKELAQIAQQNPKAAVDPNTPLGFHVSPEFVKNTLQEAMMSPGQGMTPHIDPNKAAKLVSTLKSAVQPNSKVASLAVNSMKWQWTKLYPFVFSSFEKNPAAPEVRQLWSDIVGVHKRMYQPVAQEDVDKITQVPPELWKGKQWWDHSIDQIGDRVFPNTEQSFKDYSSYVDYVAEQNKQVEKRYKNDPAQLQQFKQQVQSDALSKFPAVAQLDETTLKELKQRMTWEKRFNGMTKSENVRGIYQHFLGKSVPPYIEDYLRWRDTTKKSRKSKNAEYLLRRYVLAINRHERRLDDLVSVRNSLRKVGSTPHIDSLISSAAQEAFRDLETLSRLL